MSDSKEEETKMDVSVEEKPEKKKKEEKRETVISLPAIRDEISAGEKRKKRAPKKLGNENFKSTLLEKAGITKNSIQVRRKTKTSKKRKAVSLPDVSSATPQNIGMALAGGAALYAGYQYVKTQQERKRNVDAQANGGIGYLTDPPITNPNANSSISAYGQRNHFRFPRLPQVFEKEFTY